MLNTNEVDLLTNISIKGLPKPAPLERSHAYRDTASFGRRHEYVAAAELLKRGFDVFMTLVDDQGIDCVIRLDESRYIDVQIKARSCTAKQWNFFAAMKFEPRANLWFIFYTERSQHFWVMPSRDVLAMGNRNKNGKNKGKIAISLPKLDEAPKAHQYAKYRDEAGFDLMRNMVLSKRNTAKRRH